LWQQVEMIGHEAIGAKEEGVFGSSLLDGVEDETSDADGTEIGNAIAGTESQEIRAMTDVVLFRQTDGLVEALPGVERQGLRSICWII